MKKFIGYLMIVLLFAGSVCGVVFGVKLLQANQQIDDLYTQEEVQEQYKEYINQIREKSIIIGQLNSQIEELNLQIETLSEDKENNLSQIDELESEISTLEAQVSEFESQILLLQNEITRLEGLLESYEELAQGTYEVDFYIGETLFVTKAVKVNSALTENVIPPESNEYRFDGWSLDKSSVIDVNTYQITNDTVFYALLTPKYKVEFMNDGSIYETQYVAENDNPTSISNPTKDYYQFIGWLLNDEIVNPIEISVTTNLTFVASYSETYEWVEVPRNSEAVGWIMLQNGDIGTEPFENFNVSDYAKIRVTFNHLRLISNTTLDRVVLDENHELVEYKKAITPGTFTLEEGQVFEYDCAEYTSSYGTTSATKIKISFEWDKEDKEFLLKFECENSVYKLESLSAEIIEVYQTK